MIYRGCLVRLRSNQKGVARHDFHPDPYLDIQAGTYGRVLDVDLYSQAATVANDVDDGFRVTVPIADLDLVGRLVITRSWTFVEDPNGKPVPCSLTHHGHRISDYRDAEAFREWHTWTLAQQEGQTP